jgi:hypothetical protein
MNKDKLNNMEFGELVADFAELRREETGYETTLVGIFIIGNELYLLDKCTSGEELKKEVIALAEAKGEFAGLEYVADDFLDTNDVNYTFPDDGLSWVAFGDIWNTLVTISEQ